MNREETAGVLTVLKAAYPHSFTGLVQKDAVAMLDLWATMLSEYPAALVTAAVKTYIAEGNHFPPAVGEIMATCRKLTQPEEMSETEAWDIVRKALSNSTYNSQREFDALPPDIQRVVHSASQLKAWAMDDSFNESVISSNFMRSYRAVSKAQREYNALPSDVKLMLEGLELKRIEQ